MNQVQDYGVVAMPGQSADRLFTRSGGVHFEALCPPKRRSRYLQPKAGSHLWLFGREDAVEVSRDILSRVPHGQCKDTLTVDSHRTSQVDVLQHSDGLNPVCGPDLLEDDGYPVPYGPLGKPEALPDLASSKALCQEACDVTFGRG